MSESITLKAAAEYLQSHDNYYILIHQSPDGDAIGSGYGLCFALRLIGKKANVMCSDPIPEKYDFITSRYEPQRFTHSVTISTDLADTRLLGKALSGYSDYIELAIDHHKSNTGFADKLVLDSSASSACEVVYEILTAGNMQVSLDTAICLYTGIATDTGCFKYECTTPRCHVIASKLMEQYNLPIGRINRTLFDIKSMERLKFETKIISNMQVYLDGKCAVAAITLADLERYDVKPEDTEGVASLPMQIKGVEVGITLKEREENKFKVSMRSAEFIDVSEICAKFGGGGHTRAAGCFIEGDVDQVRMKILAAIAPILGMDLWMV